MEITIVPNTTSSLITVLLGGVLSGVVAAYASYIFNRRKEDIVFLSQKAEDLFTSSDDWNNILFTHFIAYYGIFKNEINFDEVNRQTIERGKAENKSYQKTRMLISIYFPELHKNLEGVHENRSKINKIIQAHKVGYKQGRTDGRPFLREFDDQMAKLNASSEILSQGIIESAQNITSHRTRNISNMRRFYIRDGIIATYTKKLLKLRDHKVDNLK